MIRLPAELKNQPVVRFCLEQCHAETADGHPRASLRRGDGVLHGSENGKPAAGRHGDWSDIQQRICLCAEGVRFHEWNGALRQCFCRKKGGEYGHQSSIS